MDLDEIAFVDVEGDPSGRPLVPGGVRGGERPRIDFETATGTSAAHSAPGARTTPPRLERGAFRDRA